MSLLRKLHLLKCLLTVALAAPLLMSCYNYDQEEEMTTDAGEKYINLTIAVNSESQGKTRAPLGGENGDGREAGFQRENMASGITLILYEDETGINTSENPTLAFVKFYPTTLISRDDAGAPQTGNDHIYHR